MNKHYNDIALLLLRIGFAGSMLTHGIPKISKLFNTPIKFADPLGVGDTASLILTIIGEVLCPILILIGFKTKWMSIPASITMIVAAFIVHGADSFAKKEKAILYAVAFIVIFLAGAGKYSLDAMLKKR